MSGEIIIGGADGVTDPPTPATGYLSVYGKNGNLHQKDDQGTVTDLSSGGGGGGGQTDTVTGANGITNTGDNVNAVLSPTYGTGANEFCQGNDSRLNDARTPTAHATTHVTGGSDKIRDATASQDGLATSTQITKLDGIPINSSGQLTGALDANSQNLNNVKNASFISNDAGNSSTALTIDWNNGAVQKVTLTDNCTFSFTDPPAGMHRVQLAIVQDGTGSRTAVWPGTVRWGNGNVAPALSSAAGSVDIVTFLVDTAEVVKTGAKYYGLGAINFGT